MAYPFNFLKPEFKNTNIKVKEFANLPTALPLKKCSQTKDKSKRFHRSLVTSKILENDNNVFEKQLTRGYQQKWIPVENVSLSHKTSSIPVILTSPDGKVKELLRTNNKSRVTFGQGIQSNLGFWLPKVETLSEEFVDKVKDDEIKSIDRNEKTDDNDLREFGEALRRNGLNLDRSNTLLHVCRTVDEDWIGVSKENVIRLKQQTENPLCISIKDISSIYVDSNYLAICMILDPIKSDIAYLEIIPGQLAKTESLITSLLFASSRLTLNSQVKNAIGLISVPLLELPSCKEMARSICEVGKPNLYSGVAIVESVELETNINDELMMQMGSDKYHPVNVQIRGRCLKIVPNPKSPDLKNYEDAVDVNIAGISSLKLKETPRPHTLTISWESKSMNLSSSNSATANELFGRLRTFKDGHSIIPQQAAYLILSEYFLFIFAVSQSKELLLQNPALNLTSLGNPEPLSILLASSTKEADESICSVKNTCWWKLTFFSESECRKCNDIFSSLVDSSVEN